MKPTSVSPDYLINSMPFSPRQWIIVVLCTLAVIFDGYEMQMISYVMPIISKQWQLNPIQSGIVGSWGFVGMLFGAIILGLIADYIGRKKALIVGLGVFSIFIGCGVLSTSFVQLATFRFLAGLGMGGVLPIAITLISEFAPIHLRARTIAIVTGGFTLGFALAATLSTLIIPVYGWKPMFVIGMTPLLFVPFLILYLPESIRFLLGKNKPEEAAKIILKLQRSAGINDFTLNPSDLVIVDEDQTNKSTIRELWSKNYRMITLRSSFMYLFLQIVVVAFNFWLAPILIAKGFSLVRSYSYGIEQGLAAAFGGFLLGWFIDFASKKYSRKYSMAVIFIIGAISLWLFSSADSITALFVFNGLASMFIIGGQNIVHSMITDVYPTRMRSTAVGWGLGVGRIGSILGPTLGGILLSLQFSPNIYFVLFSLPLLIVTFIILSFPKINDSSSENPSAHSANHSIAK